MPKNDAENDIFAADNHKSQMSASGNTILNHQLPTAAHKLT